MKSKKEIKQYLDETKSEYDYQSSEDVDESTEEELKEMEYWIEILEWVLK